MMACSAKLQQASGVTAYSSKLQQVLEMLACISVVSPQMVMMMVCRLLNWHRRRQLACLLSPQASETMACSPALSPLVPRKRACIPES